MLYTVSYKSTLNIFLPLNFEKLKTRACDVRQKPAHLHGRFAGWPVSSLDSGHLHGIYQHPRQPEQKLLEIHPVILNCAIPSDVPYATIQYLSFPLKKRPLSPIHVIHTRPEFFFLICNLASSEHRKGKIWRKNFLANPRKILPNAVVL